MTEKAVLEVGFVFFKQFDEMQVDQVTGIKDFLDDDSKSLDANFLKKAVYILGRPVDGISDGFDGIKFGGVVEGGDNFLLDSEGCDLEGPLEISGPFTQFCFRGFCCHNRASVEESGNSKLCRII